MQAYDEMPPGRIVPFAMLAGPQSLQSPRINTDRFGFRHTSADNQVFKVEDSFGADDVNLLIGGSTAFGVGATSDQQTVASLLARSTGQVWLNLGIRGATSLQEYIHLIRFVGSWRKIRNIVFFSGVNDMYVNLLHDTDAEFDRRFEESGSLVGFYSWQRQAVSQLASRVFRVEPEAIVSLPLTQMVLYPFTRKKQGAPARLSIEERLERFWRCIRRNMLLYSALGQELNCDVFYLLQPFASWTGKSLTPDEELVFRYLEEVQRDESWSDVKRMMSQDWMYAAVVRMMTDSSSGTRVNFIDTNSAFARQSTLFVDNIHLTDEGYSVAADQVRGAMNLSHEAAKGIAEG